MTNLARPSLPGMSNWRFAGLLTGVLLVTCAAVFLGVVDLPPAEILAVLSGRGSREAVLLISDLRLPRVLTGVLVGIHLAVSGLLLQSLTRNPLADPTILGVAQGALLAVAVFLFFAVYRYESDPHILTELPIHWLPLIGCVGGLAAAAYVFVLAARRRLDELRITLCGIAIAALLHAAAMGIIAGWGSARLETVMQWLSGSLYARGWEHVMFLLPFTGLGLVAVALLGRSIALLRFEEDVARSLGLAYRLHFGLVLGIAAILAASAVGVAGPLIFVGLVVPHLARSIAGRRPGLVLPLTILIGAGLVTVADLIGRLAGGAEEIPVGIVTAVAGAPILMALLRRLP
jgi:iron complex transport system permease protein